MVYPTPQPALGCIRRFRIGSTLLEKVGEEPASESRRANLEQARKLRLFKRSEIYWISSKGSITVVLDSRKSLDERLGGIGLQSELFHTM